MGILSEGSAKPNNNKTSTGDEKDTGYLRGAVVYSDGGARPNPGFMGWGAHGYTYTTKKPTQGLGLAKHVPTIKGYQLAIHKDRLSEQLVTPISYFDFMGSSLTAGTNNVAELDALYHTLEKLKDQNLHCIYVLVDSEYVRRGLAEWSKSWVANNWQKWDGTPVQNTDRWKRLLAVIDHYNQLNVQLDIHWVKGHQDDLGNELADKLATVGTMYSKDAELKHSYRFSEPSGYWKPKTGRHPFLNFRRLYFNSVQKYNTPGRYFQAEPGCDEIQFGKKTSDTSYSIVELYEPDQVVEAVKQKQFDVANEFNAVMLMKMDEVFADSVYPYIQEHGKRAILSANNQAVLDLYSLNKRQLTEERNPVGLSLRAIESSSLLEDLLEHFKNQQSGIEDTTAKNTGFQSHDITEVFYTKSESNKNKGVVSTLKPEYVVGFKDLKVAVNVMCGNATQTVTVPLVLGADLLPRNNLKRLEVINPSVHLLTWKESEQSLRYACVVKTDTGIGIWSNFFANRIFVQPTS